jgi:hypothetical protein
MVARDEIGPPRRWWNLYLEILGVKFQYVVHSIENWEAQFAKQRRSRESEWTITIMLDWRRFVEKTSEEGCGRLAELEGGRGRVQAQPAECSQVGQAVSGEGRGRSRIWVRVRIDRHAAPRRRDHGDRAAEAATLDGGADRATTRAEPRHGQESAAAFEAEPHPPAATQPLWARGSGHLDIKRLVRIRRPSRRVTGDRRDGVKGIDAEFLHVAIDDHSQLAFTARYPDQTERSSTHFRAAAVAWYGQLGIAPAGAHR